jgi:CHAT domain-containing protein/Tfp pilus assembly protein PilF
MMSSLPRLIAVVPFMLLALPLALAQSSGLGEVEEGFTLADTARARGLYEEAVALSSQNKYQEALEKLDSAKAIYLMALGEKSQGLGKVWNQIGNVKNSQDSQDEALVAFQKALEITEEVFGYESREVMWVYNNIGLTYEKKGMPFVSIGYLEKAGKILSALPEPRIEDVTIIQNNMGQVYSLMGQHDVATKLHEEALNTARALPEQLFFESLRSYDLLGRALKNKGDFKGALSYHEEGLNTVMRFAPGNKFAILAFCNNIGIGHAEMGEYGKAIQYYENALNIAIELFGDRHLYLSTIYGNLGISYKRLQAFDKALDYFQRAVELEMHLTQNEPREQLGRLYHNMAGVYTDANDFNNAFAFYEKALGIYETIKLEKVSGFGGLYNDLGVLYFNAGDWGNAIQSFEKALEIRLQLHGEKHPFVSHTLANIAECQEKLGNYSIGEHYFRKACLALNYLPSSRFEDVVSVASLLRALPEISAFYYRGYLRQHQEPLLYKSWKVSISAIDALNYQFRKSSPASKIDLSRQAHGIYSSALPTNLLLHQLTDSLHYLHEAFDYAERSKAMLLYEALQEANALKIAGIPDSLLQQEYDLRVDIAYFETKRQEKINAGLSEADTVALDIASKLFDLNRRYEMLKSRFEQDYLQYYAAKYDLSTVSLEQVQRELLQPGQSLVEYLVGDSAIYIFLVQPDYFEVHEVKRDFPLEEWVRHLTKEGIYGFHTLPAHQRSFEKEAQANRNYTQAAQDLYAKLWMPMQAKLGREVIIVPDGLLSYLPFEALLSAPPPREGAFAAYPYLLNDHQLSYSYSATLLKEMREKQHHRASAASQLLAMAPFFQGDVHRLAEQVDTTEFLSPFSLRDTLIPLPSSGREAAAVAKIWNSQAYFGAEASKALFQQLAPQYRILHLSTHAQSDDRMGDYAYLAFGLPEQSGEFSKVYARELYNLSLNADLVFLSACETGTGRLRRGEGIVSLARAFAYAGAKSLVTTLWKVSDEKTAELAVAFYALLKKGLPKDEALHRAKTEYLKKNKGRNQAAHPFFWAGFIAIGDMRPLD